MPRPRRRRPRAPPRPRDSSGDRLGTSVQRIVGSAEPISPPADDAADSAARDAFARLHGRQALRARRRRMRERADGGAPCASAAAMASAASRSMPCLVIARSRAIAGSVSVPVLSNSTCVTEARSSSASGRTTSTPRSVSTASARVTAAGAASANAHGHATTSTATVAASACDGSTIAHPMAVHIASTSTRATKPAAARSPARASRGFELAARVVSATMPATTVSAPTRVTRMVAGVPATMLPAHNASPRRFWRGVDSPQSSASSTRHCSVSSTPSAGTLPPSATTTRSPGTSSNAPTRSSVPSASTRSANTGVSRASASDRSPAWWRARISR